MELDCETSFVDFDMILADWSVSNTYKKPTPQTKLIRKQINEDKGFLLVNEEDLENTDEIFTDNQWKAVIKAKDKKLIFEQNSFVIKNDIIKRGSSPLL